MVRMFGTSQEPPRLQPEGCRPEEAPPPEPKGEPNASGERFYGQARQRLSYDV